VTQLSFFGPNEAGPDPKPDGDAPVRLRLLITVKAAPNPSEKYGETVCVAALSIDPLRPGWVRLYPINHRELTSDDRFRKYEIISVMARPARRDQRRESWKPIIETIAREAYLPPWEKRRRYLDPWVEESMCRLNRAVRDRPDAQSLALIRPARVDGLRVTPHGGWTPSEQRKIDAYVSQLDLLDNRDRVPLEAPRFRAAYRYQCHEPGCKGHLQGLLDWELVALQRRLRGCSDAELRQAIEEKFLHELCAPTRDVAFYVGNQAKRVNVFSVLGVYWPPKRQPNVSMRPPARRHGGSAVDPPRSTAPPPARVGRPRQSHRAP
jgi:hypothetical protein